MIELLVGLREVAVWRRGLSAPVVVDRGGADGVLQGLHAVLGRSRRVWRPGVRAWLTSAWVRPFLIQPVQGLRSWAEAEALAAAQGGSAAGLSGECAVAVEEWPGGDDVVLGTVVQLETVERVRASAMAGGARLMSMRPVWASPLNQALRSRPALPLMLFSDSDGLTAIAAASGRTQIALAVSPSPGAVELESLMSRLTLSHDLDRAAIVRLQLDARRWQGPSQAWVSTTANGGPA